jgi:transposase
MVGKDTLKAKYELLSHLVDERTLRICMAADALAFGHGGVSFVAKTVGASRTTIHSGIREIQLQKTAGTVRNENFTPIKIRKPGGGRRKRKIEDKTILEDLDRLVDPETRGDPMSPLRWTCKSTTNLAKELKAMGHKVSQSTVWRLLEDLGYSMQSNRKIQEGADHEDRDEQFGFISSTVNDFMACACPVVSVDTKKKELVGEFKNAGREWQKKYQPVQVNVHDFPDKELGKAIPYGVYDIGRNEGWVSVGVTHDTSEFAVETIRRWWFNMGRHVYPNASKILITADGGGSNGSRVRLWKTELQKLATEIGKELHIRHFPPGTSKWNKIEHRMFCHITENWRGRPLESRMAIVNLISNTRTQKGLSIKAEIDDRCYETGKKISDEELDTLSITHCRFHGEWNYCISPKK